MNINSSQLCLRFIFILVTWKRLLITGPIAGIPFRSQAEYSRFFIIYLNVNCLLLWGLHNIWAMTQSNLTLLKQAGWYRLSGFEFSVAGQLFILNVTHTCLFVNVHHVSSPSSVEYLSMSGSAMLLDKNDPARNNTQHSAVSLHKFENTGAIQRNDAVLPHIGITTPLLSIERADWPKLHDMLKARDSNTWQRQFPVGFRSRVSGLLFLPWICYTSTLFSYRRPMRD